MSKRIGQALGAFGLAALVMLSAAPASAEDASTGTPLSVNVTDGSTATPTPSASPSAVAPVSGPSQRPGSAGSSGGSGAGSPPGEGAGAGSGTPVGSPSAADEVNVAGMLYVGGINASATPSLNPAAGTVEIWFTVRNASESVIDATASFWMDGSIFTNRLDEVRDVPVAALQPGETRVVSAQLQNGGQWTLLSTYVELTPPGSVDGATLTPVTRDALVILFPWLLVLAVVLVVLSYVLVRVLRSALAPAAAPVVVA